MKLLCDQMLGSLATWLRILGVDTFFTKQDTSDDELLKIAKHEQRTLITRDKELLQHAKKELVPFIKISTTDLNEQLRIVLDHINIEKNQLLTRCTICNTTLGIINKTKIKDQVPKRIYENHDTFWYCTQCKKVYWMGTHYENMIKKISDVTKT